MVQQSVAQAQGFAEELEKIAIGRGGAGAKITSAIGNFLNKGRKARPIMGSNPTKHVGTGKMGAWGDRLRQMRSAPNTPSRTPALQGAAPAPAQAPQGGSRFLGYMPGDATYERRVRQGLSGSGR